MTVLHGYRIGSTIGRGEFAIVKLAELESAEDAGRKSKFAIKVIERSRVDEKVQREIANQRSLDNQHIIKLVDVIETDEVVCLVTEYAPKGDLFDYIVRHGKLDENEGRRIFGQLIAGVGYCHENMVVHRDLKPENVLMDSDYNIKIADFGLSSKWAPGERLTESCGSPNYAAPEIITKGRTYEGPEVDVWSSGVVLYTLLCGCLPFDDENVAGLFKKIKKGRYSLPGHLSAEAKDLIRRMLTVDPAERIGLSEISDHPWFKASSASAPQCDSTAQEIAELSTAAASASAAKLSASAAKLGASASELSTEPPSEHSISEPDFVSEASDSTYAVDAIASPLVPAADVRTDTSVAALAPDAAALHAAFVTALAAGAAPVQSKRSTWKKSARRGRRAANAPLHRTPSQCAPTPDRACRWACLTQAFVPAHNSRH